MILLGWLFLPAHDDRERYWHAPENYVRATVGEIRLRPSIDTPLDDTTVFEPGWQRAPWLNHVTADQAEVGAELDRLWGLLDEASEYVREVAENLETEGDVTDARHARALLERIGKG